MSNTSQNDMPAAGLSSSKLNRSITHREGSPSMLPSSPERSKNRNNDTSSPSPNKRYDFLSGAVTSGTWSDWRNAKGPSSPSKQHYQTITADNLRASRLDGSPSPTRSRGPNSVLSGTDS